MSVCPPEAILSEEDVPAEHQADIIRNAAYFAEGPGYWYLFKNRLAFLWARSARDSVFKTERDFLTSAETMI